MAGDASAWLKEFTGKKHGAIQKFMDKKLAKFVRKFRKPIIALGLLWLIFSFGLMFFLERKPFNLTALLGQK